MKDEIPIYTIESLKSTDAEAKEFDFFRFEYFARDIEHLRAPHRHHFYTFILVTGGGGAHSIDFHDHELIAGRLFLIAPGQVHAWINLNEVKGFVVLFNDSFLPISHEKRIISEWPLFKPYQQTFYDLNKNELKAWEEELVFMEEEFTKTQLFYRDAIFYSLSYLLVKASRLAEATFEKVDLQNQDYLFRFQELIELHFLTLTKPKEYADLLGLTPNYLNSICKKKSGKSAGELIRQRILLEAKRLLAHTTLSVSEIGFKLNFQDNSYFGRFFKKYCKLTPNDFRLKQIN